MGKQWKAFLMGVAATLTLYCVSLAVVASPGFQTIEVLFDNVQVLLHGQKQELKDAVGKTVEPFLYQDSVYVPLRAVAELLGKKVSWDDENKTVQIEEADVLTLPIDAEYVPLPDVNADQVQDRKIDGNEVLFQNQIYPKTALTERIILDQSTRAIERDGAGNYFLVAEQKDEEDYDRIKIIKYTESGKELRQRVYEGNDFDMPLRVFYMQDKGIVLMGLSQSTEGVFASAQHERFVALIDENSLEIKWVYHPDQNQHIQEVYRTEGGILLHMNQYSTQDFEMEKPSKEYLMKLDFEGKTKWTTWAEESSTIGSIATLTDGKIVYLVTNGTKRQLAALDQDGQQQLAIPVEDNGILFPTDDGGFILVDIRMIKALPQPVYISSIWMDTETTAAKYDGTGQLQWRKTYDGLHGKVGVDYIVPQPDSSLIIQYAQEKQD